MNYSKIISALTKKCKSITWSTIFIQQLIPLLLTLATVMIVKGQASTREPATLVEPTTSTYQIKPVDTVQARKLASAANQFSLNNEQPE